MSHKYTYIHTNFCIKYCLYSFSWRIHVKKSKWFIADQFSYLHWQARCFGKWWSLLPTQRRPTDWMIDGLFGEVNEFSSGKRAVVRIDDIYFSTVYWMKLLAYSTDFTGGKQQQQQQKAINLPTRQLIKSPLVSIYRLSTTPSRIRSCSGLCKSAA